MGNYIAKRFNKALNIEVLQYEYRGHLYEVVNDGDIEKRMKDAESVIDQMILERQRNITDVVNATDYIVIPYSHEKESIG